MSLDFTGDNRRGASQRSDQCGDCCSTQKSVHKSGDNESVRKQVCAPLTSNPGFEVISESADGLEGVRHAEEL